MFTVSLRTTNLGPKNRRGGRNELRTVQVPLVDRGNVS